MRHVSSGRKSEAGQEVWRGICHKAAGELSPNTNQSTDQHPGPGYLGRVDQPSCFGGCPEVNPLWGWCWDLDLAVSIMLHWIPFTLLRSSLLQGVFCSHLATKRKPYPIPLTAIQSTAKTRPLVFAKRATQNTGFRGQKGVNSVILMIYVLTIALPIDSNVALFIVVPRSSFYRIFMSIACYFS
jgi:hypothetical protein